MLRGKCIFKCDDCGHRFEDWDTEWAATIFTYPMPCPKCGSRHTYPAGGMSWLSKHLYRYLWGKTDEPVQEPKGDNRSDNP